MTFHSRLKLALCSLVFLYAVECAMAQSGLSQETAKIDSIITLESDVGFQQLDADHQRIAQAIYEFVIPKVTARNAFIDPVKFSIYGAGKVVADLKKQNTENIENRAQAKKLLVELVGELRGQGIEPETEIQADPLKLFNWLVQNDKGLLSKFPSPLRSAWREKANKIRVLNRADTTIDMLLAPGTGNMGRPTDPPYSKKPDPCLLILT